MEMTPGLIVDGLMVVLIIGSILAGWRQGAYASILSTIGVVAGMLVGVFIAPLVMQVTQAVALRFMLAIGIIVMLVGVGISNQNPTLQISCLKYLKFQM